MTVLEAAVRFIPPAKNTKVFVKDGATRDIIKEVLDCFGDSKEQLKKFAPYLQGATVQDTCNNIWNFWKNNITYKVDGDNVQWVKEPARVWSSKFCDCKSFSVAVACSLYALGIDGKFRFASYGLNTTTPTHVYVVAMYQDKEIIIDCVWTEFGTQKPFAKNWDYNMSTAIYRLAGLDDGKPVSTRGRLGFDINDPAINEATMDLLVKKQRLELEQLQAAKIHGIGSTRDNEYEVAIMGYNNALAALGVRGYKHKRFAGMEAAIPVAERDSVGSIFSSKKKQLSKAKALDDGGKTVSRKKARLLAKHGIKAKKVKEGLLKKIGKGIKKGLSAVALVAIKKALPQQAPFFLYIYLKESVLANVPPIVLTKRQKALNFKKIIVDKLGMKPEKFEEIIRNGIMSNFGKGPEDVIADWMKAANFKIGIIPIVLAAGKILISLLKKLIGAQAEKIKADVANFTPAPEDWGSVSPEAVKELEKDIRAQPDNDGGAAAMRPEDDGGVDADGNKEKDEKGTYNPAYKGSRSMDAKGNTRFNDDGMLNPAFVPMESNPEDAPAGDGPLTKSKDLPEVTVTSSGTSNAGGIVLGLAALGIMLGKK